MPLIDVCTCAPEVSELDTHSMPIKGLSTTQNELLTYSLVLLRPPSTQIGDVSWYWCAPRPIHSCTTRLRGHCCRLDGRASSSLLRGHSSPIVKAQGTLLVVGRAAGWRTASRLRRLPPWGRWRRPGLYGRLRLPRAVRCTRQRLMSAHRWCPDQLQTPPVAALQQTHPDSSQAL